jgi:hypothetical protein
MMTTATMETAERKREYNRRYMRRRREDPAYLERKREYMRKFKAGRRARTLIADPSMECYAGQQYEPSEF